MRRLFVLGVVLIAVVIVAAVVGFVILDRGGAPSADAVKAFDRDAVRRSGAQAGRIIDATVASLDMSPAHVRTVSDVDACYADQQSAGFSSGFYNKSCFRRKVLLFASPISPLLTFDRTAARFTSRWLIGSAPRRGPCYAEAIALPRDRDPRGVDLEFTIRPADRTKLDRSLPCLLPVGQLAGTLTMRAPATERDLVFMRRRVFDDGSEEDAVRRAGYPTVIRLGFTVQYYSRRID